MQVHMPDHPFVIQHVDCRPAYDVPLSGDLTTHFLVPKIAPSDRAILHQLREQEGGKELLGGVRKGNGDPWRAAERLLPVPPCVQGEEAGAGDILPAWSVTLSSVGVVSILPQIGVFSTGI